MKYSDFTVKILGVIFKKINLYYICEHSISYSYCGHFKEMYFFYLNTFISLLHEVLNSKLVKIKYPRC